MPPEMVAGTCPPVHDGCRSGVPEAALGSLGVRTLRVAADGGNPLVVALGGNACTCSSNGRLGESNSGAIEVGGGSG
jgi:hypothetical protein